MMPHKRKPVILVSLSRPALQGLDGKQDRQRAYAFPHHFDKSHDVEEGSKIHEVIWLKFSNHFKHL